MRMVTYIEEDQELEYAVSFTLKIGSCSGYVHHSYLSENSLTRDHPGRQIHIILEVTDNGILALVINVSSLTFNST